MIIEAEKLTGSLDDDDEEDEAFLRKIVLCEEDRRRFTLAPWAGGFRWFRSPNIIPLEQWRRKRQHKLSPNGGELA